MTNIFTNLVVKMPKNCPISCCNTGAIATPPMAAEPPTAAKESIFWVEVTLTLKPNLYKYDVNKQLELTKPLVKAIFKPYRYSCVCELTKLDFNIHYHCLVETKTKQPLFEITNRIRKYNLFGRRTVQQVQYLESYKKYLNKDLQTTIQYINGSAIIHDDLNILGIKFEQLPP